MQEQGRSTPLDIRPNDPPFFDWYMKTFNRLSMSRNAGMSIGYIPMSEYLAYFSVFEPLDGLEMTMDILVSMDQTFVSNQSDKN